MAVTSERDARRALDEVARLQEQAESGEIDLEVAGREIIARIERVVYFGFEHSVSFGPIVGTIRQWAHTLYDPRVEPDSPQGFARRELGRTIIDWSSPRLKSGWR